MTATARPKNADATTFRSGAEAVENGRKGGKASGAARKARKTLKEALLLLLNEETETGETYQEAMIAGVLKQAIAGDVRAAVFVRDTIGEKPEERMKLDARVQKGDFVLEIGPGDDGAEDPV